MQTEPVPTEGQNSAKLEAESALRDAARSSSSSRRLRRFTPKELDAFQEARAKRPPPVWEGADTPHIVFPKGARFVSDFPMTHDEIKAVADLMFAGQKMQEASTRLLEILPTGAWHQFYGNWNLLRISNREPC